MSIANFFLYTARFLRVKHLQNGIIRPIIEKNLGGGNMEVTIRRACCDDIARLHEMLLGIAAFHGNARPDIFKTGSAKYSPDDLKNILQNPDYHIFVADGNGVCGYVFCILQTVEDHPLLQSRRELYVDDLYVEPTCRGKGIATLLMEKAKQQAEACRCDCLTLNVWNVPHSALALYEKLGYTERKRYMELPL